MVDDGSTRQETLDYLDELEKKNTSDLVHIVHQKNRGANARLTDIQMDKNEFIIFLEDDDELEPDAREFLEKTLLENKVDMVWFLPELIKARSVINLLPDVIFLAFKYIRRPFTIGNAWRVRAPFGMGTVDMIFKGAYC